MDGPHSGLENLFLYRFLCGWRFPILVVPIFVIVQPRKGEICLFDNYRPRSDVSLATYALRRASITPHRSCLTRFLVAGKSPRGLRRRRSCRRRVQSIRFVRALHFLASTKALFMKMQWEIWVLMGCDWCLAVACGLSSLLKYYQSGIYYGRS